ncbi:MAG: hypothetical protein C4547_14090 [Phycisphaerales bacterium]|nr:MAG: hypothetical protein C4547_14090 [Phycisphaerales bacterium]
MRNLIVFSLCACLAVSAYAGQTDLMDLTYPEPSQYVLPNNPTGISAAQAASIRVATNGTQLQYVGVFLDGDGVDQIYVKVQQQNSSGTFHTCGFYRGEGAGGWPGMTGGAAFFTLPGAFSEGDMLVEHDGAGNVKLTLSNLVPSQPDQIHERGGWIPRNGDQIGIHGYTGVAAMDDFSIETDSLCDDFNRPDGALGPDWRLAAGGDTGVVRGGRAYVGSGNVRARYTFVGECGGPACNYNVKKSKAKDCDVCPPKGGEYGSGVACEVVKDCAKKLKETIPCPDGGNGTCKLKGKRSSCG